MSARVHLHDVRGASVTVYTDPDQGISVYQNGSLIFRQQANRHHDHMEAQVVVDMGIPNPINAPRPVASDEEVSRALDEIEGAETTPVYRVGQQVRFRSRVTDNRFLGFITAIEGEDVMLEVGWQAEPYEMPLSWIVGVVGDRDNPYTVADQVGVGDVVRFDCPSAIIRDSMGEVTCANDEFLHIMEDSGVEYEVHRQDVLSILSGLEEELTPDPPRRPQGKRVVQL